MRSSCQSGISYLIRADGITEAPFRKDVPSFSSMLGPPFYHIIRDILEIQVGCRSSLMLIEFFKQFVID